MEFVDGTQRLLSGLLTLLALYHNLPVNELLLAQEQAELARLHAFVKAYPFSETRADHAITSSVPTNISWAGAQT